MSGGHNRALSDWWWSLDRSSLFAIFGLVIVGTLMGFATSPAEMDGRGDAYYYAKRHIVFAGLAGVGTLTLSTLSVVGARRLGALLCLVSIGLLIAVLFAGFEANGSRRWISLGGVSVQPVEIAKPALVLTVGWLFSAQLRSGNRGPGHVIAALLYALVATLLLLQTDMGQTVLITATFFCMFFVVGLPVKWLLAFLVVGGAGFALVATLEPYILDRLLRFGSVDPTGQVGRALAAIGRGGLFGTGPGAGEIKYDLPDPHTDFVFAVAVEEFGFLAAALILGLYATIVIRSLLRARHLTDTAAQLSVVGLALLIGFQALVHIGVNLSVLPVTGMTLPLVSSGRSSMVGMTITCGLLLALTRRRPGGWTG